MPDKTCSDLHLTSYDKTIISLSTIILRGYFPKISNYMYRFVYIVSMALQ